MIDYKIRINDDLYAQIERNKLDEFRVAFTHESIQRREYLDESKDGALITGLNSKSFGTILLAETALRRYIAQRHEDAKRNDWKPVPIALKSDNSWFPVLPVEVFKD